MARGETTDSVFVTKRHRVIAALEVALMLSLILIGQWWLPRLIGSAHFLAYYSALFLSGLVLYFSGYRTLPIPPAWRGLHLRTNDGFPVFPNLKITSGPAVIVTLLGVVVLSGLGHSSLDFAHRVSIYPILTSLGRDMGYALLQDLLIFEYFGMRARLLFDGARAGAVRIGYALSVGLLVAIVHAPNPFAMALTGCAATIWAGLYAQYPSLLPIVAGHATLRFIARDVLGINLAVGLRYYDADLSVYRAALSALRATLGF